MTVTASKISKGRADNEIVLALIPQIAIQPLELHESKGSKAVKETWIAARDQSGRSFEDRGLYISKRIPFTGNADLWGWGAGQPKATMPRGKVYGRAITIGMVVSVNEGEAAVTHINSTIARIQEHLALQRKMIYSFNNTLLRRTLLVVQARRDRLASNRSLLDNL